MISDHRTGPGREMRGGLLNKITRTLLLLLRAAWIVGNWYGIDSWRLSQKVPAVSSHFFLHSHVHPSQGTDSQ